MKHKEQLMQLGLDIAFYGKLKGLTQEDLAEMMQLSRNHISKMKL